MKSSSPPSISNINSIHSTFPIIEKKKKSKEEYCNIIIPQVSNNDEEYDTSNY